MQKLKGHQIVEDSIRPADSYYICGTVKTSTTAIWYLLVQADLLSKIFISKQHCKPYKCRAVHVVSYLIQD